MSRAAIVANLILTMTVIAAPANSQMFSGSPSFAQGEVDLSGGWLQKTHQDLHERGQGPDIGDYTGLPINDAARLRADTWDSEKWTVPEHQCEPHPADYGPHGPANLQISKIVDPRSLKTTAIQVILGWMTPVRTIWLDGRPHPSPNAARTWQGFSTGHWEGDTLIVNTTHMKEGWIRRNGIARSDKATLTEYWMRHDDVLTLVSIVNDPVYLTEPFMRTWNWTLDAGVHITPYTCVPKVETDRPQGYVAHWLPGQNPFLNELPAKTHLPAAIFRGGREQNYPEYQDSLATSPAASAPAPAAAQPDLAHASQRKPRDPAPSADPAEAELDVVRVRDNIFMLVGPASNTTVEFGDDGVMVVNTQSAAIAPKILAAIKKLTDQPIRYIVNTDVLAANTGGNIIINKAGKFIGWRGETKAADILAHENVLQRMSGTLGNAPAIDAAAWPQDTYYKASMDLHFNGEAIQLIHEPNAHTDGDSIVFFRGSDVICTGDLFVPEAYPHIDAALGGSFQGLIDALNRLIDMAIPDFNEEGGTMIIPGHGRLTDEYELVTYRDMLTIIRDRVQDMIARGFTLKQVLDAKPSSDYDGMYGSDKSTWTAAQFVESVYTDLKRHTAGH